MIDVSTYIGLKVKKKIGNNKTNMDIIWWFCDF